MTLTDTHPSAIIAAGTALAAPTHAVGQALAYVVPEGYKVEVMDAEKYGDTPRRKEGTAHPHTVQALIDYVARHQTAGTTVWVHPDNGKIEAVIDDHTAEFPDGDAAPHLPESEAGFGKHRAFLHLSKTPEWEFWTRSDGQSFNQVEFAEHIEEGSHEVVDPTPLELLEIAQTFQAKRDVSFRSAVRLKDGVQQFQYDEDVQATAGKGGTIEIPDSIKLAISPFLGEAKYAVTARFRYRLSGGKLSLSYKLDRPDDVVRDALASVAERLRERFPNVYIGTPR